MEAGRMIHREHCTALLLGNDHCDCRETLAEELGYQPHPPTPAPPSLRRDPDLIRAEIVDTVRDCADSFRDKAAMEIKRAERLDELATQVQSRGIASEEELNMTAEWMRAYKLQEMRYHELKLRLDHLITEIG
jgi:hypothetical protein